MRVSFTQLLSQVAAGIVLLLALAACGGTADRTPPVTEPNIVSFMARPLDLGEGQWELSWEAAADEVSISGADSGPLDRVGTINVVTSAAQQYILRARIGSNEVSSEPITLAGLDSPATLTPAGPQQMTVGDSLNLDASATATGSDVEPSQAFIWSSSDVGVVTVSEEGRVQAVGIGTATVQAVNTQWNGAFAEVDITVQPAPPEGITDFAVVDSADADWYAGSEIEIRWQAHGVQQLQFRLTDSTGLELQSEGLAPTSATHVITLPTNQSAVNLELVWELDDGSERTTLLFPEPEPVPGWLCSDPESVITFGDTRVEAEVRKLPYVNRAPGESIRCGDVQPASQPAPDLDSEYQMEQSNLIFLNRCYTPEDMRITSTEGLQHLIQLARLELECNRISDIRFLASMTGLNEINFDNNHIEDLSPLADLLDLEVVGLYNNRVRDTAPLSNLENLRILYLSANHVQDVSPLSGLQNLELLWLFLNCQNIIYNDEEEPDWGHDCLSDASPLEDLTSLESLVLLANDITDVDFLNADMTELELVLLAGNSITDISPLGDLPAMTSVVLNDNPITDLTSLAANTDFPAGEPYLFTRGTVSMPSRTDGVALPFPGNLILGFNCLSEPTAQLAAFGEDVEISIVRDDESNLTSNCDTGLRSLSVSDLEQRNERLKAQRPGRDAWTP